MVNEHSTWAAIEKAYAQDINRYNKIAPDDLSIEDRIEYVLRLAFYSHDVLAAILRKQAADEAAKLTTAPHTADETRVDGEKQR